MNHKSWFLITLFASLILIFPACHSNDAGHEYINPTGTYSLVNNVKVSGEEALEPTGSILVKTLEKEKVVIVLGAFNGAPVYNSGALIDTLVYKNNICTYMGDISDTSCRITFVFTKSGVKVTQKQADLNNGCGFGQGVFADGFYKKGSATIPVLRNPQTDELLR